jgi:glycosyltransferase involved in cell wall biosynthesis
MTTTVLFVHHANDMYGADIGLLHSLSSLDREQYYPVVLLPADMVTGPLSEELSRRNIEYHFVPLGILRRKYLRFPSIFRLGIDFARGVLSVRSLVRKKNAKLVYANTFVTVSGALGARLAGVPVLWHIREIVTMPRPIRVCLYWALKACATHIVCVSKAVRDALLREAPELEPKTVVLYNAVSLERSGSDDSGERPIREELDIHKDQLIVGMVGRITHWKGQDILVDAAATVLKDYPDVHFVAVGNHFAGEIHYVNALKARIDELGIASRFHLLGYRTNVAKVYESFDIAVLPSKKPEPFGRVTVEAMMSGRPVIGTAHGGTPELIQNAVTGLLVPPGDPVHLADAIQKLLADKALRLSLGEHAAVYAKETFSLSGYKETMSSLVENLISCKDLAFNHGLDCEAHRQDSARSKNRQVVKVACPEGADRCVTLLKDDAAR